MNRRSLCFVLIKQSDSPGSMGSWSIVCYKLCGARWRTNWDLRIKFCQEYWNVSVVSSPVGLPWRILDCVTCSVKKQWQDLASFDSQLILFQEPTLFPKVRIQFADFPYLHYSNRPEADNLGDLLRYLVRIILWRIKWYVISRVLK